MHGRGALARDELRARIRIVGALLGGSLSALGASAGYWLGASWSQLEPLIFLALAVVAGALVGCLLGPEAVRTKHPVIFATVAAAYGAVAGTVALYVIGSAFAAVTGSAPAGASVAMHPLLGLSVFILYGFIIAFPLTLPVAFGATVLLRIGAQRPRALLAATAALLIAALVAVPFVETRPFASSLDATTTLAISNDD
jgi:hypothetical protein